MLPVGAPPGCRVWEREVGEYKGRWTRCLFILGRLGRGGCGYSEVPVGHRPSGHMGQSPRLCPGSRGSAGGASPWGIEGSPVWGNVLSFRHVVRKDSPNQQGGLPLGPGGSPWSPHSLARSPGLQSGLLSQELQHGFPVLASSLGQLQAKWGTYQVPVPEHTGTKSSQVRRRVPRTPHTWRKKGSTAGRWSENRGIGPFSPIRHVGIFCIPTSDQGLQEQTHPQFLGLTETKSVFLLPLIGTHWI